MPGLPPQTAVLRLPWEEVSEEVSEEEETGQGRISGANPPNMGQM